MCAECRGMPENEKDAVAAIRELEDILGWEHQYPIVRQDVRHGLLPAAADLVEHDPDPDRAAQAADLLRKIDLYVDSALFEDGISSRYIRDRPCNREILVSRNQYRKALQGKDKYDPITMLIPDDSDRIRYVSAQAGGSYPDAEVVPLFWVREGETPSYLAEWGMTFKWVD